MKRLSTVFAFLLFFCGEGMEPHVGSPGVQENKPEEVVSAYIKNIVDGSKLLSAKCDDGAFLNLLQKMLEEVRSSHKLEKMARGNVELDSAVQMQLYSALRSAVLGFRNAFQKVRGRFDQIIKKEKTKGARVGPANNLVQDLQEMGMLP